MPRSTTSTSRSADLGAIFRAAREGAGLPIRQLASMAEVGASTISRWERGEREVSESTYQHLSAALAEYMADSAREGAAA